MENQRARNHKNAEARSAYPGAHGLAAPVLLLPSCSRKKIKRKEEKDEKIEKQKKKKKKIENAYPTMPAPTLERYIPQRLPYTGNYPGATLTLELPYSYPIAAYPIAATYPVG